MKEVTAMNTAQNTRIDHSVATDQASSGPAPSRRARSAALAGLAAAAVLVLAACAGTTEAETPAAAPQSESFAISDAWAMAAEEGMSAAFGVLENTGTEPITVVSVTTPASDMVELHETVANDAGEMVMKEKDGGFVIPAGTSFELAPGGNHIMFMSLPKPIVAGEEIELTLHFSDDSSMTVNAVVKDFTGAEENYESGDDDTMEMDH